jgi:hypothetical protein
MSTKYRLKKITEADRCVIAQTHERNYICKLISFMKDAPIVNQNLCCFRCDTKLYEMYAIEVNAGRFRSTFEHFKDIYLENSLCSASSLANCEHNSDDSVREFDKKLQDFQTHVAEKVYSAKPKNEIESLAYLRSQRFRVQEVKDGNRKYIVNIPYNRMFVTNYELEAINKLSDRLPLPTFGISGGYFTVYRHGDELL